MKRGLRPVLVLLALGVMLQLASGGCASTEQVAETSEIEAPKKLPSSEPIVLVCQIDTVSSNPGLVLLSYALGPLIRRDLFCVEQLSVFPTADTRIPFRPYFLTERGLRQYAMARGTDIIIVGLIRGDAEKISLVLKAYDVNKSIVIKRTVEGKPARYFELQRSLVYEFLDSIGIEATKEERKRIKSCSPRKLQAALNFGDGLKCERIKRNNKALFCFRDALQADKSIAVAHIAEARVLKKIGAPLKAMQSLEEAVERDEFFAEAWYQLNLYAAEHKKRDDLAMEYCKKALEIAPRFGKAQLSLGMRLHALGDIEEAIKETKPAVRLLKTDPLPRYNLGIYTRDSGNLEAARFWFEQALKINPGFEPARSELQKLNDT